jgi:hypothetical protein
VEIFAAIPGGKQKNMGQKRVKNKHDSEGMKIGFKSRLLLGK